MPPQSNTAETGTVAGRESGDRAIVAGLVDYKVDHVSDVIA